MKIKNLMRFGLLSLLVLACSSTKKVVVANTALDQLMNEREFTIEIKTAEPQLTQAMSQVMNSGVMAPGNSMARIDVTGSGFFISVQGDSVSADLPYYGERQMGGGYDPDQGIKFNGLAKNMQITKDESKQSYLVKFSVNSSTENFVVFTSIANNATSTTAITSSQRNRIRYTGKATTIEDENQ